MLCPCVNSLKGVFNTEMEDQALQERRNSSSVTESDLHMMKDEITDTSRLEILHCSGNNRHAIYFESALLQGLLSVYCLEILPVLLT